MNEPRWSESEATKGRHASVLLVDDEVQLARNLRRLLERDGFEVTVAPGGAEAIAVLEEQTYDLLVTDLMMPGVDGTALMEWVAEHAPGTPVIVITGYGTMESAVSAIRRGASDYLTKPFEYDLFKLTVEKALERKRLEVELSKYTEQLEEKVLDRTQAIEEMQVRMMRFERLAAVGELVSIIAHEVRNPLVAIGGFARRLAKGQEAPEQTAELAGVIVGEVDRLEKLLESMLGFSRSARPNLEPVDPAELVEHTVLLFEGELRRAGIRLETELSPDGGDVLLDVDQVRGVIINLVMNAIQAMPGGGTLRVSIASEPEGIAIEVADTGPGVPEDLLEHLFDTFFTTKPSGTGLGLAIARKVVEAHGGRLELQKREGWGSVFRVLLPGMRGGSRGTDG